MEIQEFNLSKGATKAIELLNEKAYTLVFDDNKLPSKDVLLAYRVLFQLINFPDIHQGLDDAEYWRRVVSYLRSESKGKIGDHLKELTSKLDFSTENIFCISKLVDENYKKISPTSYSRFCATTGFIAFYLKDAFDYMGLNSEEKRILPQRLYKNATFKRQYLEKVNSKLQQILDKTSEQ